MPTERTCVCIVLRTVAESCKRERSIHTHTHTIEPITAAAQLSYPKTQKHAAKKPATLGYGDVRNCARSCPGAVSGDGDARRHFCASRRLRTCGIHIIKQVEPSSLLLPPPFPQQRESQLRFRALLLSICLSKYLPSGTGRLHIRYHCGSIALRITVSKDL